MLAVFGRSVDHLRTAGPWPQLRRTLRWEAAPAPPPRESLKAALEASQRRSPLAAHLGTVRFSHQDLPSTNGQGRHHCRSGACASGGAKCRVAGPAPSSRDRRRQRLVAALTRGADRTRRAGADSWSENLSLVRAYLHRGLKPECRHIILLRRNVPGGEPHLEVTGELQVVPARLGLEG